MKNYFKLFLVCCSVFTIGCVNDSTDDLTDPPEVPIVYEGIVGEIFNNNCISCHGLEMPQAGISLHTYAAARFEVEVGKVLQRMVDTENPMPPTGLLPSSTVEIIQEWKDNGFPVDAPPPEEK